VVDHDCDVQQRERKPERSGRRRAAASVLDQRYHPWDAVHKNNYQHVMAVWTPGTIRVYVNGVLAATKTGVPTTSIDYSSSALRWFTYNEAGPTNDTLEGAVACVAVWASDQSANVADIYAEHQIVDWQTLASPPDVVHYRIGPDDDPTVADGILDRSGNGLDATMINGDAGDVITVTPGYAS